MVLKGEFNFNLDNLKYFAGHSLEYSALVSSGSLKFEDAIFLLHEHDNARFSACWEGQDCDSWLRLFKIN